MIEQRLRVAFMGVASGGYRGNSNAQAISANGVCASFGDLEKKPGPVLYRAAVDVTAMVGAVTKKGVEQISMGAMHLDAVEPRYDGAGGRMAEIGDDAGKLVQFERAGRGYVYEALPGDEGGSCKNKFLEAPQSN